MRATISKYAVKNKVVGLKQFKIWEITYTGSIIAARMNRGLLRECVL